MDQREVGLKYGFRSGLEETIASQLTQRGVPFTYEAHTYRYVKPAKPSRYTPDFILPNGVIIETKGRFLTADRQKHVLIKKQYPHLDLRFIFNNPNARISKTSKTTYADWCDKYGFQYAAKRIPDSWLEGIDNVH